MQLKQVLLGYLSIQAAAAGFFGSSEEKETVKAEELENEAETAPQTPKLDVHISTAFPNAEVFGVKLVNGYAAEAAVSITNNEPAPITVQLIGGSLWSRPLTPEGESVPLRNISSMAYNLEIAAGQSESLSYKISTEMHPQDVVLKLVAVLSDSEKKAFYTMAAFEEVVSIVEAPTSIFDPQIIFLYLLLGGGFAGTAYFVYKTWASTLFPQQGKRKGGKDGGRAKTTSTRTKKVDPDDSVNFVGADGPAVTTGAKTFDESWIPQSHMQRPQARKIRSGTPSGVKPKRAA